MREKIKSYQTKSCALDPDALQRKQLRDAVISYTEEFLDNLPHFEKSPTFQINDTGLGILHQPIGETPIGLEQAMNLAITHVDNEGINPASGGHLGYISGGGLYASSLGDYWAAITNRYAGIFFANSGAVRMENQLINWMKDIMGYPVAALGNLASGGSIASLTAVVTARDAHQINAADTPQHVIYLSKQAHHCFDKAFHIAGLRECPIRVIELDDRYRMDPDHLRNTIKKDIDTGLKPWLLVGSAGTTDTGAVDPLIALADIAMEYGLWFHVDAAYGGFFMLTEDGKKKLRGIDRSDSLVIDPHKGMFLPFGIGVVLVKNGEQMQKSFSYEASYMQDEARLADEVSPAQVSPELTKHFRGLRMWLPLMLHGVGPFRAALEEKLLLAKYTYQKLKTLKYIMMGPEPELSLITFRFIPESGDANAFNEAVVKKIHDDGRIFLSSTTINGVYTLRFAILSFRTHLETIDLAIRILKEKVEEVTIEW